MRIPFLAELEDAQHILLAGAGGGFDIFAGLPLYYTWRNAGKRVSLANLSFSQLLPSAGDYLTPDCVCITADSDGSTTYFPEKHLAAFLGTRGDKTCVYAIRRTGARPVREAYAEIYRRLGFDALVLIDGGTDSLMRGDEQGLGTPEEDMASLLAADSLSVPKTYLACMGFGVDYFHGVCDFHALEAIAELTRAGAFRGAFSVSPELPEFDFYRDAVVYAQRHMQQDSIVNCSVIAAIAGQFGNHHTTKRTAGTELRISPLMALYWTFLARPVAARLLYRKQIENTETYSELRLKIEEFHDGLPAHRPYTSLR